MFNSMEESDECWGDGRWNLQVGSVFLREWTPKFVPSKPPKKPNFLKCVWVHFLGICFEDIKPRIIRSLGRALGLVIKRL